MKMEICIAIIIALVFRVIIMRGYFVFPQFYELNGERRFNLGSIGTVVIGVVAALTLGETNPELFASPLVAFLTAYTAPQILDATISAGTRVANDMEEKQKDIDEGA